jgi:hypothetical protein
MSKRIQQQAGKSNPRHVPANGTLCGVSS